MKDGVPILLVPPSAHFPQGLHQFRGFPRHHPGNYLRAQLLKQPLLAAQIATIKKRNAEFEIIAVQNAALLQATNVRAHAKMQIPKRPADLGNQVFLGLFAGALPTNEEQVNIGTREQRSSSVTADRSHTQMSRFRA
ncbi:MAG TPA: hypothetical protein VI424_20420 [Terriglobales bacterium]